MQNPKAKLSTINGIIRDEKIFRVRFIYAKKVKGEMCKRCDVCMKAIEMKCEWNTMLCIVEQILEEQLSTGILERFAAEKDNEKKKKVRYLPHHAVIRRDRETTKLRNVYDDSAKHAECTHSLND